MDLTGLSRRSMGLNVDLVGKGKVKPLRTDGKYWVKPSVVFVFFFLAKSPTQMTAKCLCGR